MKNTILTLFTVMALSSTGYAEVTEILQAKRTEEIHSQLIAQNYLHHLCLGCLDGVCELKLTESKSGETVDSLEFNDNDKVQQAFRKSGRTMRETRFIGTISASGFDRVSIGSVILDILTAPEQMIFSTMFAPIEIPKLVRFQENFTTAMDGLEVSKPAKIGTQWDLEKFVAKFRSAL